MTTPTEARDNPGQDGQKHLVVLASWARIATRGDVIESMRSGRAMDAVYYDDVIVQDVTP